MRDMFAQHAYTQKRRTPRIFVFTDAPIRSAIRSERTAPVTRFNRFETCAAHSHVRCTSVHAPIALCNECLGSISIRDCGRYLCQKKNTGAQNRQCHKVRTCGRAEQCINVFIYMDAIAPRSNVLRIHIGRVQGVDAFGCVQMHDRPGINDAVTLELSERAKTECTIMSVGFLPSRFLHNNAYTHVYTVIFAVQETHRLVALHQTALRFWLQRLQHCVRAFACACRSSIFILECLILTTVAMDAVRARRKTAAACSFRPPANWNSASASSGVREPACSLTHKGNAHKWQYCAYIGARRACA